jgi:CTP synthase
MLHDEKLDDIVCRELQLKTKKCNLSKWNAMIDRINKADKELNISLVGKYIQLHDAYLSVMEALKHSAWEIGCTVNLSWVDSETLTEENIEETLKDCDGIIVPGGFGNRGIEGMILSATYAQEKKIPYFGICLGMQIAVMSYARNVLKWEDANSSEFDENTAHAVIDLMEDQVDVSNKGGTMRLGAYPCKLIENTVLKKLYKNQDVIYERHRHRYEFNNKFRDELVNAGLTITGVSPDDTLVEAVEIKDHPFFLGVQYHPEFKSRPNNTNACFNGFISAAKKNRYK